MEHIIIALVDALRLGNFIDVTFNINGYNDMKAPLTMTILESP